MEKIKEKCKNFTKITNNQSGVTLIALIVTIIVLIIIAGISIATLTSDNGILRQTDSAKVAQIEGTAREQVKLATAAMRVAIAEASAKDNSYSAKTNASAIKTKLLEVIKADSIELDSDSWADANLDEDAGTFEITYSGDDYKNACNDTSAKITYTITLGQKSIEITNEINATLKDQNGNNVELDIGSNTETGTGSDGSEDDEVDDTSYDIFPEQTLSFSNDVFYNLYIAEVSSEIGLTNGETYVVVWDGTEYTCVARDFKYTTKMDDGQTLPISLNCALGNATILKTFTSDQYSATTTESDTGEPFIIQYYSGKLCFRAQDTSETHTVRIYQANQ